MLGAALCAGPAFAAQNVGNTSQKGSLLIFPLIEVDSSNAANTFIEISNDNNLAVHVECNYVNERKGRVDFNFNLTPKATVSFDVLTGSGDIQAPQFPINGTFPGNAASGELICFAVDGGARNQIAFNHLTGTATVVNFADTGTRQSRLAFKYNSWNFAARNDAGFPEADNAILRNTG